ncbi:MAG: GNAT family N-acetyltransferase [Candidatus Bathyarchaeota archaeon]|nr:GNAT family N-acetyltransferase [Candidatus Bathyarchaeota archaeon]
MKPSKSASSVTIEHMTAKEVEVAIEWAAKEGWNPGIHDAECFYAADPDGFYIAKLNHEIAGTMSVVKYSGDFAFGGLYIVKPEYRGYGIGLLLQKFLSEKYRDVNVGIDGVVGMQSKYEQDGFRFAHNNARYAGKGKGEHSKRCLSIEKKDFTEVAAYDTFCFSTPRQRFLEKWLFQEDANSLLVRDDKTDRICGYGVIRKCWVGYKVGPLFADNSTVAELLFDSLSSTAPNEVVFLDVPQPNTAATQLAQKRQMQQVFSTVRMYSKEAPNLPLSKIYGITSFELG